MRKFKLLPLLSITAAMLFVSASAYAEGNAAKIGDNEYITVNSAIENANGGTVTLISDVTEDVIIPSGTDVTLDLNGKTLTNAGGHTIINNGSLTVKDTVGGGVVDNVTNKKIAVYNEVGATAVLDGGKYTRSLENGQVSGDGGNSSYVFLNHGTMTINSGVSASAIGKYSSLIENGWQDGADNTTEVPSNLTINGGMLSGGKYTIKNDEYGSVEITGGTFSDASEGAFLNWNIAKVSGGTFSGTNVAVLNAAYNSAALGSLEISDGTFNGIIKNSNEYGMTPNLTITGGSFTGINNLGKAAVSGGTFTQKISDDCLANGFTLKDNGNGTYSPEKSESTVTVSDTDYESGVFNDGNGMIRFYGKLTWNDQAVDEIGIYILPTESLSSTGENVPGTTSVRTTDTTGFNGEKFCADLKNIAADYQKTPVTAFVFYKLSGEDTYTLEAITTGAMVEVNNNLDYANYDDFISAEADQ